MSTTQELEAPIGSEQPDYLSFLLRLWRVGGEEEAGWRASLESAQTGERKSFASLDELIVFLQEQTRVQHTRSEMAGSR